jgi:capsular exopolysaccharide synthesis family protein
MSKIEKALSKAREEGRNLPVAMSGGGTGGAPAANTALISDRIAQGGSIETIARMAVKESRLFSAGDLSLRGIIHPEQVEDPAVQVFRELRTKIIQQGQGQNGVILVTAVSKGSGSSFVAQNLGAAFAFDAGKTALVIDCNLKNPSMHRLLVNASAPGLTDYLENPDFDIAKIIRPVGIARYRVITTGKRREIPAEYFTSVKMRRLIDTLKKRYMERFIILDGPPMTDIADIRILSELCDHVIVVARYGRVTNTQMETCLNVIGEKKLLSVVFNDEPRIPRFR